MKNLLLMFITLISLSGYSQNMTIDTRYYTKTAGVDVLRDGVISVYNPIYCNCVDGNDAVKLGEHGIGLLRSGQTLSIEARDTVDVYDTTYFKMMGTGLGIANGEIALSVKNVYPSNLTATLYDAYLSTSVSVSTLLGDTTKYYYLIDANPLSSASNRFKLVLFNPAGYVAPPLPPPVAKAFNVYPNPVSAGQTIHIEYPDSVLHEFYLISATGIKYNLGVLSNNSTISLPAVSTGMYLLYDPKNKQSKKIMIL